jgi:hypothetical protein
VGGRSGTESARRVSPTSLHSPSFLATPRSASIAVTGDCFAAAFDAALAAAAASAVAPAVVPAVDPAVTRPSLASLASPSLATIIEASARTICQRRRVSNACSSGTHNCAAIDWVPCGAPGRTANIAARRRAIKPALMLSSVCSIRWRRKRLIHLRPQSVMRLIASRCMRSDAARRRATMPRRAAWMEMIS